MMSEVFASIDLGGTNIHAAIASADGSLLAELKQPTRSHEGPEVVVGRMIEMILELSDQASVKAAALGIGVPGLVDVASGTTRFLPNMPTQWRGVPVAERMEAALGFPVRLLNDARTATLGEMVFGHGKSVSDLVFFTLGTGVGGGVAQLGELLIEPVKRTLHERVGMFPTDDVQVLTSQLGDRAGLLGGIALAASGAEFIPQLPPH